jgi:hypothetical protein
MQDGNLSPIQIEDADVVGLNVLGAPNFPEVQNIIGATRKEQRVMLGGQIMRHLIPDVRRRIFGEKVIVGNYDTHVSQLLRVTPDALPAPEAISLISAYELLSEEELRAYLTQVDPDTSAVQPREIPFYLSQGCGFNCDFCAADKNVRERYREAPMYEKDLRFLMNKAKSFGVNRMEMYISNLDLFQTPKRLMEFAQVIQTLKSESPGFSFGMRGLSTTKSFVECEHKLAGTTAAVCAAGLHTIGFGIDGTPAVWKEHHFTKNSEDNSLRAMQLCNQYGITPEVLMIIGQQRETPEQLEEGFETTMRFIGEFGAASRPHVYKPLPGSSEWESVVKSDIMELLLRHREAWTAFDVLAGPSPVSHPDEEQRRAVATYFERYLALPVNRTAPVRPLGWWLSPEERREAEAQNALSHDR